MALVFPSRILLCTALVAAPLAAQVDFQRDVRPILSDRCFQCHGPDEASREAELRLDDRASATADRGGYAAIVPGDPANSALLQRVRSHDTSERMPPPESGLALTTDEIATLEAWIRDGANYEVHWAFRTPTIPEPPVATARALHPIDRFVFARLQDAELPPAPAASPEALLRRVHFTLTGLPPTLEDLDAFLADPSPAAYERVVDELLASEAYAERMTAHWLDVARYADTYGYQNDRTRRVWPWRDWVIRAFHGNLPFDDFLTWQIAGDMLPDATRDQRLATTFARLHRQTNEGGSVAEEMRVEYVADRMQTVATAFLGLTAECARCHDHKFDPLTQKEYYELTAFFDNIDEFGLYSHFTNAVPTPALLLTTPEQDTEIANLRREIARNEAILAEHRTTRREAFEAWRAQRGDDDPLAAGLVGHYSLDSVDKGATPNAVGEKPARVGGGNRAVDGKFGRALELTGDDAVSLQGVGAFHRYDPFTVSLWVRTSRHKERTVILHRSRAWSDAGSQGYELLLLDGEPQWSLIHFWPGDAVSIRATEPLPLDRWVHVAVSHDGSARAAGLGLWVDGAPAKHTVVRDKLRKSITGGGNPHLTLGERFRDRGFAGGGVDEVRVYDRALSPEEVRVLAGGNADPVSLGHYLTVVDPEHRKFAELLREIRKRLAQTLDKVPGIMTLEEDPEPRPTFVRERGAYDAVGARVAPDVPAFLPAFPADQPRNRLGLARWMTDAEHPLTARIAVNRFWQLVFGVGLVATSDNFGSQGELPTHPALLDWLARDFVAHGWDVKRLVKSMVMSETFRFASDHAASRATDPDNRLLARASSPRLPFEMLRDQALAVSGLLDRRVGGGPVRPYQPPGLWKEKSGQTYHPSKGRDLYRRSLYTFWKRTSPPPSAMIFDAAKRDVCVTRRQVTNTPLQALVLLDDPQFVEAARALATRIVAATTEPRARVTRMFRALTSRTPREPELVTLESLLDASRAHYSADPAAAQALLAVGDSPAPEGADPVEIASYATLASTLMSYDATVTRR